MIPGFRRTGFGRLNIYPSTVVYLPWGHHQQYNYKHLILFDIFIYIYILYPVVPSGKRLHSYGKSPCYSWINPRISMAIFNSKLFVYQRVYLPLQPKKEHLVGGFNPSEKKLVSWDDYSQYMEK